MRRYPYAMRVFSTRAACAFFLAGVLFAGARLQGATDDEIPALVGKLKKSPTSLGGNDEVSDAEGQLIGKKEAVIPYILPLLKDKNPEIRYRASLVLNQAGGVTEADLQPLIDGCQDGQGPYFAIAKIGTPKAAGFLVDELMRWGTRSSDLTEAVNQLGGKAVPYLVAAYRKKHAWDSMVVDATYYVFSNLGTDAGPAVDPLLKIATDASLPPETRRAAILAIGCIGLYPEKIMPVLRGLAQSKYTLVRDGARSAIVDLGVPEAVPFLVEELDKGPDKTARENSNEAIMRHIGMLGENGKSAGPALMKYFDVPGLQMTVAFTMGRIGYEGSADALIKMLDRRDDWRLVMVAMGALARLHEKQALTPLERISREHWYPPVRKSAVQAMEIIRSEKQESDDEPFSREAFSPDQPRGEQETLGYDEAKFVKLPVVDTPPQIFTVLGKVPRGKRTMQKLAGIAVKNGCIVGDDRGEWGGETTFFGKDGSSQIIINDNTEAIYNSPSGIIVVTGLAHMASDYGAVYKVHEQKPGKWVGEKWRELPGAPRFSLLLKDGRLFVNCNGGMVTISPDGEMKCLTLDEVTK